MILPLKFALKTLLQVKVSWFQTWSAACTVPLAQSGFARQYLKAQSVLAWRQCTCSVEKWPLIARVGGFNQIKMRLCQNWWFTPCISMGVWGHTQSRNATFLTVEGHPPEHCYRCNKAGHIKSSGAKSIANITAQPPNASHVGYLWIFTMNPAVQSNCCSAT